MQKFSEKILAEIKGQKIAPRSRLLFLAKNYGIWALAVLGILFAGIFTGNLIHEFATEEWDIAHHFPGGRANFLFHAIPFLWLFGLASAFAFAFFLFRKTKKGYKYSILITSGIIFVLSGVFGAVMLSTSLPPKLQELREHNFPSHFDQGEWMNPEGGFLFGEIVAAKEKLLILDALDESVWEVDISAAQIPPKFELAVGDKIRAIGEKIGEQEFAAEFIRPEMPSKMREIRGERKMPMRAY